MSDDRVRICLVARPFVVVADTPPVYGVIVVLGLSALAVGATCYLRAGSGAATPRFPVVSDRRFQPSHLSPPVNQPFVHRSA